MTDQPTTAPPPAAAAPPPPKSIWARLAPYFGGVVVVIVGGSTLLNYFVLPGCDSSRITYTVRSIYKSKDIALTVLDQVKALPDQDSKTMCEAHIETPDEKATIQFSITWDGWSPFVKIEKVDTITS